MMLAPLDYGGIRGAEMEGQPGVIVEIVILVISEKAAILHLKTSLYKN